MQLSGQPRLHSKQQCHAPVPRPLSSGCSSQEFLAKRFQGLPSQRQQGRHLAVQVGSGIAVAVAARIPAHIPGGLHRTAGRMEGIPAADRILVAAGCIPAVPKREAGHTYQEDPDAEPVGAAAMAGVDSGFQLEEVPVAVQAAAEGASAVLTSYLVRSASQSVASGTAAQVVSVVDTVVA